MELTILERIILQGLLPQEGSYVTFRVVRELRNELSFTEKEIKDFEIKHEDKRIVWNMSKEKTKVISIGDSVKGLIVEALKKLDSEGKINNENISVYEKFIT
jgi:predicted Zn-dependent protease